VITTLIAAAAGAALERIMRHEITLRLAYWRRCRDELTQAADERLYPPPRPRHVRVIGPARPDRGQGR
jgi:hypothetical protein